MNCIRARTIIKMLVLFETAAGYAIFKVSVFVMLQLKSDVFCRGIHRFWLTIS